MVALHSARPAYALIAGLELDELARAQGPPSPPLLFQLHRDLLQGRWELSAQQVGYYLGRLEERGQQRLLAAGETEYLRHLKLARALQEGFRAQEQLRPGAVYAYALTRAENSFQTFYTPLPAGPSRERLAGFSVDLNWIETQLLPQCARELPLEGVLGVGLRAAQRAGAPAGTAEVRAAFKTLFPFLELSLSPAQEEGRQAARRDLWVFAGTTLLILGALIAGVFLLMRDVSREWQLHRLRADFVSGVSHELKTPLTLIRLYGETLLHGQDFAEEERQNYSQIIVRESERLTHLIEKVLDFSRIERGQKQYHLQEGDLAPVVAHTVELYGEYLKRRGFSVQAELADHLPPVRFDPDAVSATILNLMDNAAKYSGESKFVAVRLRSEDSRVILEVEDRGAGVSPSEREKIFQQFYRTRSGTGKGGYGLGLFLVKHVMDAHGGSIELESERGRGSRFRLIFPAQAPGQESGSAAL